MQTGPVVIVQRIGLPSSLTYLSQNFQTVFDLDPEPFLTGREDLCDRIHEADRQAWRSVSDQAVENPEIRTLSGRFRLCDGRGKWRVVDHQTIVDQGGANRKPSTLAYWIDRTKETENLWRLELTLEGARVGTWEWNPETGLVTVDSEWAQLIGHRREDLNGFTLAQWRALVHSSDLAPWDQMVDNLTSGKDTLFSLHARLRHQNGQWIWYRIRGKVFEVTAEGQPLRVLGTQEDVSELMEAQEERTLLSRVVEEGPSAVVITDQTGSIEYVNRQFLTLTGYTADELKDKNPRVLKSSATPPEVYQDLWATVTSGRSWYGEFQNVRKDGTPYWVQASISPIPNAAGQISKFVGQQVDITARKRGEENLRKAQQEAQAANQAKSDFLAQTSHEIRTPMNGILGLAELALEKQLDPESRTMVENIKASAESLVTLVNDILDVSKIEAGKLELETTSFSLRDLVTATLTPLQVLAAKKGLSLTFHCPSSVTDHRLGDPARLRQVLTNLVGNALKFTNQGAITVTIEPDPLRPGPSLRFSVQDTGDGVPLGQRHRLFQRFSQMDASTNRKFGGTGLGLAISRELVGIMGGLIGYEEALPPPGAVFWFTLMLPPGGEEVSPPEPKASEADVLSRGWRVLVVEDNPVNQQVAQGLLRKWGLVPTLATNGLEALDKLANFSFDLVFMDVQMPGMDGLETTRAIREGRAGDPVRRIPIIAMTANAMGGDKASSLEAGMDDYLTKPISAAQFASLLKKWEGPLLSRRTFDPVEMRSRLQLEEELVGQIVRLFLDDLPLRKQNLVQALAEENWNLVHRLAHTLKGTAANLVAQGLVEAAMAVEAAAFAKHPEEILREKVTLLEEMDRLQGVLTEYLSR